METTRSLVVTLLRGMHPWLASHLSWRLLIRSLVVFLRGLMLRSGRHVAGRRIPSSPSIRTLAKVFPEKEADASEDSNTSKRGADGDTGDSSGRKTLVLRARSRFCCGLDGGVRCGFGGVAGRRRARLYGGRGCARCCIFRNCDVEGLAVGVDVVGAGLEEGEVEDGIFAVFYFSREAVEADLPYEAGRC